jgi:hypothetical protein
MTRRRTVYYDGCGGCLESESERLQRVSSKFVLCVSAGFLHLLLVSGTFSFLESMGVHFVL